MRKYDILFLDIDGTLVGPDHFTLSKRNRQALLKAREAGILLSIATGRCLKILPEQVMAIRPDYAVTSNGASVLDLRTGKKIYRDLITPGQAETAYGILQSRAEFIEWFADGEILLSRHSHDLLSVWEVPPWHMLYFSKGNTPVVPSDSQYIADGAPGLEKINIVRYPREVIADIREKLGETGQFALSSSIGRSLEINRAGCDKGAAILAMCDILGIDPGRTAACGDGGNDITMLSAAGLGAAMGNALDTVKAAAACVTGTNEEDGVAEFIEKYLL